MRQDTAVKNNIRPEAEPHILTTTAEVVSVEPEIDSSSLVPAAPIGLPSSHVYTMAPVGPPEGSLQGHTAGLTSSDYEELKRTLRLIEQAAVPLKSAVVGFLAVIDIVEVCEFHNYL
jgi:hypothetical protein